MNRSCPWNISICLTFLLSFLLGSVLMAAPKVDQEAIKRAQQKHRAAVQRARDILKRAQQEHQRQLMEASKQLQRDLKLIRQGKPFPEEKIVPIQQAKPVSPEKPAVSPITKPDPLLTPIEEAPKNSELQEIEFPKELQGAAASPDTLLPEITDFSQLTGAKLPGTLKRLPVIVADTKLSLLGVGKESPWSEIPSELYGAILFHPVNNANPDGLLEFKMIQDAQIILAASWAYDGNASGNWQEDRKSKQQLINEGWSEIGTMYYHHTDRHTLFKKTCKAGRIYRIRTRKYHEPFVLLTGFVKVPPVTTQTKNNPKTLIEVVESKVQPIEEVVPAESIPKELTGTSIYDSGVSGVAILKVHQNCKLYVAASWEYDGNTSGQWTEERWSREDFGKKGWKEVGTIRISHRGRDQEHVLFSRECKKGESFRIRSRKYGAPFVFAPPTP